MRLITPSKSAAVALLVGVACAGHAFAQDSFDFYAANLNILQFKEVQTEIKLTADQRAKLNKHAAWFNGESKKLTEAAKKAGSKANPTEFNQKMASLLKQMKERAFREISAGQLKRVREISLQNGGPTVMLDEKVAAKMGVSSSQLSTMRNAYTSNSKKAADLQEKTFRPIMAKYEAKKPKTDAEKKTLQKQLDGELKTAAAKIQPQVKALADNTRATIEKTLTAQQKTNFRNLLGKPFAPPKPK